jgi:hypothetical protein
VPALVSTRTNACERRTMRGPRRSGHSDDLDAVTDRFVCTRSDLEPNGRRGERRDDLETVTTGKNCLVG